MEVKENYPTKPKPSSKWSSKPQTTSSDVQTNKRRSKSGKSEVSSRPTKHILNSKQSKADKSKTHGSKERKDNQEHDLKVNHVKIKTLTAEFECNC